MIATERWAKRGVPGLIRKRRRAAIGMMLSMVLLGAVLTFVLGVSILPIYLTPIPMGFILLWLTAEVTRADERGAASENPPTPAPRSSNVIGQSPAANPPRIDEPILVF